MRKIFYLIVSGILYSINVNALALTSTVASPISVILTFQNNQSKIFPEGSTTVLVNGSNTQIVNIVVDRPSGVTVSQIGPGPFSIIGRVIGDYKITAVSRSGTKITSNTLILNVKSPEGWSSQTGYKWPADGTFNSDVAQTAAAAERDATAW